MPLASRLLILGIAAFLAWIVPRVLVFPARYRHSVDLDEYRAAYREARWFGWEPGFISTVLIRIAIIAGVVVMAFPDVFR